MISAEDRQKLEELRSQVACAKHFACMESSLDDLCASKYHSELDILECLEKDKPPCKFARPFGCTTVCICPLRRLIAIHFERWSDESTALLRPAEN